MGPLSSIFTKATKQYMPVPSTVTEPGVSISGTDTKFK